jgi:hypothetical protein
MTAASEPATIGHLEDPAYLSKLGQARSDGTIDMPPGEAVFGFSSKASIWIVSPVTRPITGQSPHNTHGRDRPAERT